MNSVRVGWITLLLLVGSICAQAQQLDKTADIYLDISSDAVAKLQQAEQQIQKQEYQEAVLVFRKLIETFADKVVPLHTDVPGNYVSLPAYCHLQIAKFPPAELAKYRKSVDAQALAIFKQFETTGDPSHLRRIIEEFYCSSYGDSALAKLGDLSFSGANYSQAAWLWGQLLPAELTAAGPNNSAKAAFEPRYPDPDVELSRVAVKWAVAQAMSGQSAGAQRGVAFLKSKHANASGKIANRSGKYWEIARSAIGDQQLVQDATEDADWRTFAGNAARTKVVPKFFEIGGVRWNWPVELDQGRQNNGENENERAMIDARRENLSIHPLIVGNTVYLATDRRIWTFNLETGKAEKWPDFQDDTALVGDSQLTQPKHTLTIHGFRLFVRSGRESMEQPMRIFPRVREILPSWIHCYDIRTQKKLWQKPAEQVAGPNAAVEGAPIAEGDSLYVSTTTQGGMDAAAVVCLDAETGEVRWKTSVCEVANDGPTQRGSDQTLLTIGNNTVFLSTNLGVIAAVDAQTGRKRWVTTYSRTRRRMVGAYGSLSPDLSPCIFYQGNLLVAPDDSSEIQCFDASTGTRRWTSMTPAMHLIGVAKGLLVASGQRVWGIDVETGKVVWYWPESTAMSFGRGTLVGDYVCWPTKTEVHFLDQLTGTKARPSLALFDRFQLTGGNLVVGGGHFLLAQADRLVAFAPYEKLREKLKSDLAANPASATLHLQLAQLARANGDYPSAIEQFELAGKTAKPKEKHENRPLASFARDQLFDTLLRQGEKHRDEKKLDDAEKSFERAEQLASNPDQRIRATDERARLWLAADKPDRAIDVFHAIVADAKLRDSVVDDAAGAKISAGDWAIQRLHRVLNEKGAQHYQPFEERAKQAIEAATTPEQLLQVASLYPVATVGQLAVLRAAGTFEQQNRIKEARLAYLRLSRSAGLTKESKIAALLGLAKTDRALGLIRPARNVYESLSVEHGKEPMPGQENITIADFAKLQIGELDASLTQPTSKESRFARLQRKWTADDKNGFYYTPEGAAPSKDLQLLLRQADGKLAACRRTDGSAVWEVLMPTPATWGALCNSGILIANDREITCYDYAGGEKIWSQPLQDQSVLQRAIISQAKSLTKSGVKSSRARLTLAKGDILLAGDQLLAFRGKKLASFDIESGHLLWESPWELADGSRTLEQIGGFVVAGDREQRIALDLASGKKLLDFPVRGGVHQLASVVTDGKLISVVDRGTLAAFDLRTGKQIWTKTCVWPTMELPKLFESRGSVFVLTDGYELSRIDPASGNDQLQIAVQPHPRQLSPGSCTCADNLFAMATGEWLECRSASSGQLSWRAPLPASPSPWRVEIFGHAVLGYSVSEHKLMILCWDEKGKLRQSLQFDQPGAGADLELSPTDAIVSGTRKTWGLAIVFDGGVAEKSTNPSPSP